MVVVANEGTFSNLAATAGSKLIVIDFFATWCGPCKRIAPAFERMSKEFENVVFLKVDVDELPSITEKFGVSAMPTFVLVRLVDGKNAWECVLETFSGANEQRLRELVEKHK